MMWVGLNAGFGDPLAGEFPALAQYGFAVLRQDVYAHHNIAEVAYLVAEFAGAPCRPLFLIGGGSIQEPSTGNRIEPHELAALTTTVVQTATAAGILDYAIEIGNEPDIACAGYSEHPEDFAEAIRQSLEAARGAGFLGPLITGGIANLNNRGFRYLATMLSAPSMPDDVVIGFHRYPEAGRSMLAPHDRFESREDEWQMLREIVGLRPVACTEFGYHTAQARPLTLSDEDVADAVLFDLVFYEDRGALLGLVYQLNDGPGDDWMDRYGVRTTAGVWKPVAERIKAAYGPDAV